MGEQPRWPEGTPVAPSGKGPGGGRFRPSADWAEQVSERLPQTPAPWVDEEMPVSDLIGMLEEIERGPHQYVPDPAEIQTLAEDIRRRGLREPLQVEETNQGLLFTDGGHRLRAVQSLGWERVPVRRFANTSEGRRAANQRMMASEPETPGARLAAMVPADASRYGQPGTPEIEQWAHDTFDAELLGTESVVRDVYVRRSDGQWSITIRGGFPGVGRWDLAIVGSDDDVFEADIQQIHVRGSRQGEGIGTAWTQHVEQALRDLGVRRITLYDESDDGTGRSFWERMGYTQRTSWDPGNLEKLL